MINSNLVTSNRVAALQSGVACARIVQVCKAGLKCLHSIPPPVSLDPTGRIDPLPSCNPPLFCQELSKCDFPGTRTLPFRARIRNNFRPLPFGTVSAFQKLTQIR